MDSKLAQPQKIQVKAPATKDIKWTPLSYNWSNGNSFGFGVFLFVCLVSWVFHSYLEADLLLQVTSQPNQ